MAIKPIDMQTNIAQMHEVARNAQVRSEAIIEQQQGLDKESVDKTRLTKSKLEENKKAEHALIMNDEKGRFRGRHREQGKKQEGGEEGESPKDRKIGGIIDIKK